MHYSTKGRVVKTQEMVQQLSEAMITAATGAIIKSLNDGISIPYESKFKIPNSFFSDVWDRVDKEKVKDIMAENLERDIADKVTNKIATELSNDIKQVLSDKEKREEIRGHARVLLSKWDNSKKAILA